MSIRPVCVTRTVWILVALLLCARVAAAQYQVESWTTDDGLPQNVVGAINQTRDGYIWLATRDGLVRFDGVRFTVFDRNNSPGIRNNRFTTLYEAADGAIWAGTEGGGITRYANGAFATYTNTGRSAEQPGLRCDQRRRWKCLGRLGRADHAVGRDAIPSRVDERRDRAVLRSPMESQVFWAIDADGLHRFTRGQFSVRALPSALQG
jgi:hypothetical protein